MKIRNRDMGMLNKGGGVLPRFCQQDDTALAFYFFALYLLHE